MIRIGDQQTVNLVRFFDQLPDQRSEVNRLHLLGDVIVTAICAVVAGADGPTAIAKWAELNETWLKRHLKLPNGTPGKDTFRGVLSSLDPIVFQQCFGQWMESLQAAGDGESKDGEAREGESKEDATREMRHVAIDGKTLRRSHDTKNGLGPLHIVSAWASDRGIALGQTATDEKSNEITAIPELLEIIDVEDAVVTIDAAGCQKNIARRIVEGEGDYVLALKGNHKKLFDEVQLLLGCHLRDDFADCPVSRYVEVEQGHGRLEAREYNQITAPSYLDGRSQWKGLKTIGVAIRTYGENGVEKTDARYYLSSLRRNGPRFAAAVRRHWSVENTLHWSLDLTYREDESRVRDRRFAENLAWLRRMTLSLIKRHPSKAATS